MNKRQLVEKLAEIEKKYGNDPEVAHSKADDAIMEFINSTEIQRAYDKIYKWYA